MNRAQRIEKSIRLAYDSLQSHLPYCYKRTSEGRRFHIQCVKDYATLIRLLSDLY